MKENTDIVEIIKTRLELMGTSQARFAKCVSVTPTQMSFFLRGKGTLPTESLIKSMKFVGIDLSMYYKRTQLAKEVADFLLSRKIYTFDDQWTKEELASLTHKDSILCLFDVQSENEYKKLIDSGIIDIESTFPYFKALVSYYISLHNAKPTASKAKQTLSKMQSSQNEQKSNGIAAQVSKILNTEIDESKNNQLGALLLFAKSISITLSLLAIAMQSINKK